MKVVVTSEHTIKPLTPTPNHHRHFQLSYLDQIQPPAFLPLVYFYPTPPSAGEPHGTLRNSLSETLTWYYPLAGRMKENIFVDCNDEGVPFFEAQVVDCKLQDVVEERNYENIGKLFPSTEKAKDAGDLPLAIQVNAFRCGGVAIGVFMSHKIADSLSLVMFMKFWAAVARGDGQSLVLPQFGLAKIFPPKPMTTHIKGGGNVRGTKIVTRSFLFNSRATSALQPKYGSIQGNNKIRVSRVEALNAFIASVLLAPTTRENSCSERQKISLFIVQAVDLRPTLDPPRKESFVGNVTRIAGTFISKYDEKATGGDDGSGYDMIARMREAAGNVDREHAKPLPDTNSNLKKGTGEKKMASSPVIPLTIKDFSTFPHYETDFGWGKPCWVTIKTLDLDHLLTFISTEASDDTEVLVNMNETDMMRLQSDKEFKKYASLISNTKVSVLSSL